jgi:hypothetical protein
MSNSDKHHREIAKRQSSPKNADKVDSSVSNAASEPATPQVERKQSSFAKTPADGISANPEFAKKDQSGQSSCCYCWLLMAKLTFPRPLTISSSTTLRNE